VLAGLVFLASLWFSRGRIEAAKLRSSPEPELELGRGAA